MTTTYEALAQAYASEAAQNVETVAVRLEALAQRLREYRPALERVRGKASSRAADFVSEYTNGVGNLGTYLWGIVQLAGEADVYHERDIVARNALDA
jgi:hypothetical protein